MKLGFARIRIGVFKILGGLGLEYHIVYGVRGVPMRQAGGGRSSRAGTGVNKFNTYLAWCAPMPANAMPDLPISVPLMFHALQNY